MKIYPDGDEGFVPRGGEVRNGRRQSFIKARSTDRGGPLVSGLSATAFTQVSLSSQPEYQVYLQISYLWRFLIFFERGFKK